jgi:hypothetical protein
MFHSKETYTTFSLILGKWENIRIRIRSSVEVLQKGVGCMKFELKKKKELCIITDI